MKRALKVRNSIRYYFALSELRLYLFVGPGATRLAPLGACPWLLYFAPLALERASPLDQCSLEFESARNLDDAVQATAADCVRRSDLTERRTVDIENRVARSA